MSSAGLTMLLSKLANKCSRSSYSKTGNTHGNFVKWDRLTNSACPRGQDASASLRAEWLSKSNSAHRSAG
jgi:hypothetical protein